MREFLRKDSEGNWNTIPPVPSDNIQNVNCHKFILYVIGKMTWVEMVADSSREVDFTFGEKVRSISSASYTKVSDIESLYDLANRNCEIGKTYIGQILDMQTKEIAHSFITKREGDVKYNCFDKQGFKYPFSVHELGTLLDFVNKDGVKSYQGQAWRFFPLT